MSSFRVGTGRILVAAVLTLAMAAQWEAFCAGWQSPQQAATGCHGASPDEGRSAAVSCCVAQEQTRHALSPVSPAPAVQPVLVSLPVQASVPARLRLESPRRARSAHPRLLASVFLI